MSHTWGRWREEGEGVAVQGVPWLVPRITLHDVQGLPRALKEAGFHEPYLWIDLFCIPQEDTVDWQARICRQELPRQATIFQHASTEIAWFDDIDNWCGAEIALTWIALSFMKESNSLKTPNDRLENALNTLTALASRPCGFLKTACDESGSTEEPARWLSSLWTLQESIMRPDMLLLDRHWKPLVLGDSVVITFDTIVALLVLHSIYRRDWGGFFDGYPAGPKEIATFMDKTGMWHLFWPNRLTALILGRNRACTHSRAAAIMSVIGATEWFRGQTLEQFRAGDDSENLVCGLYPLEFVNEVYRKCGGSFFTCPITAATLFTIEEDGKETVFTSRGTMLPFIPVQEPQKEFSIGVNLGLRKLPDHPSVSSWTVQTDGSVLIPVASIVVSKYRVTTPLDRKCTIVGNDPFERGSLQARIVIEMNLQQWIDELQGEAHVICVMNSEEKLTGIILQREVEYGAFVKAGTFETIETRGINLDFVVPEEVSVDWKVL